jgi:hypothetical protein
MFLINQCHGGYAMIFSEMLIGLQNQKPYRRAGWKPVDGYLTMPIGTSHIYKNVITPNGLNMSLALFSLEDYNATDWQEALASDVKMPVPEAPVEPPLAPANAA